MTGWFLLKLFGLFIENGTLVHANYTDPGLSRKHLDT